MPDFDDPVTFRRWATKVHRASLIGLAILAFALAWLGFWIGGVWGLVIGGVIGLVAAFGGMVAVTLLWAMSQDGA
jgi:hypothetical protein